MAELLISALLVFLLLFPSLLVALGWRKVYRVYVLGFGGGLALLMLAGDASGMAEAFWGVLFILFVVSLGLSEVLAYFKDVGKKP